MFDCFVVLEVVFSWAITALFNFDRVIIASCGQIGSCKSPNRGPFGQQSCYSMIGRGVASNTVNRIASIVKKI